jgi:hypothetical protein
MSHPLLTKVLCDGYAAEFPPIYVPDLLDPNEQLTRQRTFLGRIIGRIPPDIADRLERALDVCAVCGWVRIPDDPDWHERDWVGSDPADHHPYQPLVTP